MNNLLTIAVVVAAWLGVLSCIVAVCAAAARADRRDDGRMSHVPGRMPQERTAADRVVAGRTAPPARRARALSH